MKSKLKILFVEDMPSDFELIKREIIKSNIEFVDKLVETREDYKEALRSFKPDIILSDYSLPQFDGMQALEIRQKEAPAVPFILVTGSINEETAVKVMKAGADDYIIKQHRARIGAAIESAIEKWEAIKAKKQAEEALRDSEELLRVTLSNITDPVFITDDNGKFSFVCSNVMSALGFSNEEIEKKGNISKILGDDLFNLKDLKKQEGIRNIERSIVDKKGTDRYFLINVKRISIGWGTILYTLHEITERKRSEEKLRQSEEKFKTLFNESPDLLIIQDLNKRIVEVNDRAVEELGYSKKEFKNMLISHVMPYKSSTDIQTLIENADAKGQTVFESTITTKFKESIPVEVNTNLIDFNGTKAVLIQLHDMSERKKINDSLIESETKYRSLIENSNDAIYLLFESRFEIFNSTFLKMFGYSARELKAANFNFLQIIAPESKKLITERIEQIKRGLKVPPKYEFIALTKSGKKIEVEASVSYFDYKNGKATQGIIRDITERKKQQEILMNSVIKAQEAEKNNLGRELHDGLGQVLTSISMYLESLSKIKDIIPKDKQLAVMKAQELNKRAIVDARKLSHGLMTTGLEEYGINHLLQQLSNEQINKDITFSFVSTDFDETLISIDTKVHLYRIAQELSNNIVKHSKAKTAKIYLSANKKQTIELIVTDNGIGFDPLGVNHGAGFENINQRVKFLKGEINVDSAIGNGTSIKIKIPL